MAGIFTLFHLKIKLRLTGYVIISDATCKTEEEEGSKLLSTQQQPPVSTAQRVDQEIHLYRSLPHIPTKDSASLWWWSYTLPELSVLAEKYLYVQASSNPSERVFSTAGDTPSPERSCILPKRANMIFCVCTKHDNLPKLIVVVLSLQKTLYFLCQLNVVVWNFVTS